MKTEKRKSYEKARNILRNNVPKSQSRGVSIILKKNRPIKVDTTKGELAIPQTITGTDNIKVEQLEE